MWLFMMEKRANVQVALEVARHILVLGFIGDKVEDYLIQR